MKKLQFRYQMDILFDMPIQNHRFTLKCVPQSDDRQTISDLQVEVYPNQFISEGQDSFGNHFIYGHTEKQHEKFYIDVKGTALTGQSLVEGAKDSYRLGMYKYQTEVTTPGPVLKQYHEQFQFAPSATNKEKTMSFMTRLFQDFKYVKGVTTVNTTAEEAMKLGQGVCQDYSHILLSLCRMEKIPARYVVGMLIGEGMSHAWVEIYENGNWIAYDPTNNLVVEDQHIKISNGRDYKDCMMNQGVFVGNAHQTQKVSVTVTEIENNK